MGWGEITAPGDHQPFIQCGGLWCGGRGDMPKHNESAEGKPGRHFLVFTVKAISNKSCFPVVVKPPELLEYVSGIQGPLQALLQKL